jgi:hypothetical protein
MIQAIAPPLQRLLRGTPEELAAMLREPAALRGWLPCLVAIVLGGGAYGAAIGLWRAEAQAVFVAIKMPLLVLLTLTLTGLLNGILGQLLGAGLSFGQSLKASLMGFALFSLIVGALSPVMFFLVLDAPGPGVQGAEGWYQWFLMLNTGVIAFAGVISQRKLLGTLLAFCKSPTVAFQTLLAWLGSNLFVGAQLSYNLRPFFSNPTYPVEFLRPHPFDSTFYEVLWGIMSASLRPSAAAAVLLLLVAVLGVFLSSVHHELHSTSTNQKP